MMTSLRNSWLLYSIITTVGSLEVEIWATQRDFGGQDIDTSSGVRVRRLGFSLCVAYLQDMLRVLM